MRCAFKDGIPVIYVDETMFTKRAMMNEEYSRRYSNIHVEEKDVLTGYIAAIAAVSAERGLELVHTHSCPINEESFTEFIEDLHSRHDGKPIAVFMDNARYHLSYTNAAK